VEQFKIDSLPEITYDILANAQSKEKGSIKKRLYPNAMDVAVSK